ncbi:MAG: fibrillarin-like rRNA methylase [Candidatus Micrarchaeota archaeon]|nr:MAG: fibrillarin-like rRNA methylase [Candidatus Micrarchaeota archaeon]
MEDQIRELFKGVYKLGKSIYTKNLVPGVRVYDEQMVKLSGMELRSWNPYRSKLSAAIMNGLKSFAIKNGSKVLYIGAATGTTVSHVSDIVEDNGIVYAIEYSERNAIKLLKLAESRRNIIPIVADARYPESYLDKIQEHVDILYQDVSSRDQLSILKKNSIFLKPNGIAYFIIKSQNITSRAKPEEIYKSILMQLDDVYTIKERIDLEPYDSKHLFTVLQKR